MGGGFLSGVGTTLAVGAALKFEYNTFTGEIGNYDPGQLIPVPSTDGNGYATAAFSGDGRFIPGSVDLLPAPQRWDANIPTIDTGGAVPGYASPWRGGYNWNFYSGTSPIGNAPPPNDNGSLIPPSIAPTGGDSSSQGSAPIDSSQTWGSLQELDPMTGQPLGQPVDWGSTTAPANQRIDGNNGDGGLTQQQSLGTTSEQLNYAAEPAQQTSGALGAINTAFGSGSGFAPADQLAPANAPVFDSGLYSALGNAVETIGSAFNSAEIASAEAVSGAAGVLDSFASTLGGFFGGGGTPGFSGGGGTPGFSGGGGTFGGFFGSPVVLDLSGQGVKITPLSSIEHVLRHGQ